MLNRRVAGKHERTQVGGAFLFHKRYVSASQWTNGHKAGRKLPSAFLSSSTVHSLSNVYKTAHANLTFRSKPSLLIKGTLVTLILFFNTEYKDPLTLINLPF